MYTQDNNDLLVNLNTTDVAGPNGTSWRVTPSQQSPAQNLTTPDGWNAAIERGYKQPTPTIEGPLFKYAANAAIMHCPGDKRYLLKFTSGGGGPYAWDSFSGVAGLNGEGGVGLTKMNQVRHPADRFIWAEGADMRGENVGSWSMNAGTVAANFSDATWVDSPAAFHGNLTDFNFCDGHAEKHKWLNQATIQWANDTSSTKDGNPGAANTGSAVDRQWVGSRFASLANP